MNTTLNEKHLKLLADPHKLKCKKIYRHEDKSKNELEYKFNYSLTNTLYQHILDDFASSLYMIDYGSVHWSGNCSPVSIEQACPETTDGLLIPVTTRGYCGAGYQEPNCSGTPACTKPWQVFNKELGCMLSNTEVDSEKLNKWNSVLTKAKNKGRQWAKSEDIRMSISVMISNALPLLWILPSTPSMLVTASNVIDRMLFNVDDMDDMIISSLLDITIYLYDKRA